MPLYEYECSACKEVRECYQTHQERQRVLKMFAQYDVPCEKCGGAMHPIISLPRPPVIGPGVSSQSQAEWSQNNRKKLEARSQAYDNSTEGREERAKALARMSKTHLL